MKDTSKTKKQLVEELGLLRLRIAELESLFVDAEEVEEEMRESQRFISSLLGNSPHPIMVLNPDSSVRYVNPALESLTGCSSSELVDTKPPFPWWPEERREEIARGFGRLMSHGAQRVEQQFRKNNGEQFCVEVSSARVVTKGRALFLLSNWVDVTERKAAEEALARQAQELERSNATLETLNSELEAFSYSVSHDLRAPLRSISGFSQALLEDCADELDARGKSYLGRIQAAVQRMGELIDDLLALSRATRSEMKCATVDLSALAQSVAAELQQREPRRQVELVIQPGVVAYGDPSLLRTVLENLLGNAWKYTSKHSQARIEFGATERDGARAFFIRDDGAGFDMAYAARLFSPFRRLHSAAEFPGTGIGLATVQRIVHRHRGRAWAEGQTERGATFYFALQPGLQRGGQHENRGRRKPERQQ